MTPPTRFWPFWDDQEVEIYDSPSWDMPGRARQLKRGKRARADAAITPSENSR